MNHTPTPWKYWNYQIIQDQPEARTVCHDVSRKNAAFIVTACNAHEDLVKALLMVYENYDANAALKDHELKAVEEALDKAGVK